MKLTIFITLLVAAIFSAASVYVYTLIDPRLEIILLKNEEIMRMDNRIAGLIEENDKLTEQVSSIASVVKTNENSSGRINDEYQVCLRQSQKLKTQNKQLSTEIDVVKSKNEILQEYIQVNNDVTALKEQIENLHLQKNQLTEQLGEHAHQTIDAEGNVMPLDQHLPAAEEVSQPQ